MPGTPNLTSATPYHFNACANLVRTCAIALSKEVTAKSVIRSAFLFPVLTALATSVVHAGEMTEGSSISSPVRTEVRVERFDDWSLRCVVPPAADGIAAARPSCEIAQPLVVSQDGRAVEILNLAISRANDKAGKADWALVVLTPLDVQLSSDFGFAAGTAKPTLLRYRNCNHLGCFVIVPLDRDRLGQIKKAAKGTAYFRLLTGQAVKISFSLKGFTKAFDALVLGAVPRAQTVNDDTTAPSEAEGAGN